MYMYISTVAFTGSVLNFPNDNFYHSMQLTVETYVASVAMLSQVIEDTENAEVEQNSGVLGSVANYFGELAVFVNTSNITINVTVSLYSNNRTILN